MNFDREEELLQEQIASIEQWWQTPRQAHIKRPYDAREIAILRSPLDSSWPANQQALKLWRQLQDHRQNGTADMTFGMIDPILATQMVGQQTIYISGALCAFSEAECTGQDTSDYPWDTVPKVAERMFRSQRYHDRKQRQLRMSMPKAKRIKAPAPQDYLQPIVADADMGFGSTTTIVKLVQRMVESGVAMFHIDDMGVGSKRFTKEPGFTVVPTSEFISRLTAARMQLDVMSAETLLMARCDVEGCRFITSTIDPRDHGYILGATKPMEPLALVLSRLEISNDATRQDAAAKWIQEADIMPFDAAVKAISSAEQFEIYEKQLARQTFNSLSDRKKIAEEILGPSQPFFDWDAPRAEDGRYRFKPTTETITERCLEAASISDVTWARMDFRWVDLISVHEAIRGKYPHRLFAAGYSATYDFAAKGYSAEDVTNFHKKLASLGIVWQLQPGYAMQGLNFVTRRFSKMWTEEGIAGYIREFQEPAMAVDTDTYEKMAWSGGNLADALADLVGSPSQF